MIRVFIHNYTERADEARVDGVKTRVEITDRVTGASWSSSLVAPYEQASVSTSIKIDELDVLGLGTPRRGSRLPALHASGWLEILDEDVRVFYGPINRLSTGLMVEHSGARKSRDVQLSATSWVSLALRPFRLTSRDDLIVSGSIYEYNTWARIFENVFSEGAAVDVAQGLALSWENLATLKTPEGEELSDYEVLITPDQLTDNAIEGRTLTRVEGRNISQVPVSSTGSLWSAFTGAFQPSPQLIELYPIRERGRPYLIYRMKPLPPHDGAYFDERGEARGIDDDDSGVKAEPVTVQSIGRVVSYTLDYSGERNNYVEVTSPYLGVSQLAGLNSSPVIMRDDIARYGLSPLEIAYPLLRETSGSLRTELERLTTYAGALYSEGHAFAVATLEVMYQDVKVGEWARWASYLEGEGSTLIGYVTRVDQQVRVDPRLGTVTRRTLLQLERVSQDGRPSRKAPAYEVSVTAELAE